MNTSINTLPASHRRHHRHRRRHRRLQHLFQPTASPLPPPPPPSRNTERGTVVGEVRCAKSVAPAMKKWLAAGSPKSRVDEVTMKDYENTKVRCIALGCHAMLSRLVSFKKIVNILVNRPLSVSDRSLTRNSSYCGLLIRDPHAPTFPNLVMAPLADQASLLPLQDPARRAPNLLPGPAPPMRRVRGGRRWWRERAESRRVLMRFRAVLLFVAQ